MTFIKRLIVLSLLLSSTFFSTQGWAHKVLANAYSDGELIEGEIGFSNGEMAPAGTLVEVYVEDKKVGETLTEEEGLFTFKPSVIASHSFKADLGSGHVANFTLPGDELGESLPAEITGTQSGSTSAVSNQELATLIQKAVAQQVIPLRKEIIALKEKKTFHDILGGIGYIMGLFGLAAWMSSRRAKVG